MTSLEREKKRLAALIGEVQLLLCLVCFVCAAEPEPEPEPEPESEALTCRYRRIHSSVLRMALRCTVL